MMTPARCLLQEEMSIEEIQQRAAQMRQQRAAAGGGKEGLVEVRPARLAPSVVRSKQHCWALAAPPGARSRSTATCRPRTTSLPPATTVATAPLPACRV